MNRFSNGIVLKLSGHNGSVLLRPEIQPMEIDRIEGKVVDAVQKVKESLTKAIKRQAEKKGKGKDKGKNKSYNNNHDGGGKSGKGKAMQNQGKGKGGKSEKVCMAC